MNDLMKGLENEKEFRKFLNNYRNYKFAEAEESLRKLRNEGKIDRTYFYYLMAMLYCEQENYKMALEFAEKAYESNSGNLDVDRIYAWALSSSSPHDKEKNRKALNIINKVIEQRNTEDIDLFYDLNVKSHILYRLGRIDEARENINRTTLLFPDKNLPRFIQLLYEREDNENNDKWFERLNKWYIILGIIAAVVTIIIGLKTILVIWWLI